MKRDNLSTIFNLMTLAIILTGIDYLIWYFDTSLNVNSSLLLYIPFLISFLFIIIIFKTWIIILEEEPKENTLQKKLLYCAAGLILILGLSSILIYSIEIILASGLLGEAYLNVIFPENETGIAYLLMVLSYFLKFLHNTAGYGGCILISVIWTRQFRIWARFSAAPFIRSFYIAGIAMIVLYIDQLITLNLDYVYYWFNPQESLQDYAPEVFNILMILFLIAAVVMPIYIYFLARGGQSLRIPFEKKATRSKIVIILPIILYFLWFITNMLNLGGSSELNHFIASFIHIGLFFSIFVPIAYGFWQWAKIVDSVYLKKNLYLATLGTFALSFVGPVYAKDWFGMIKLPGYYLFFSILIWSLANISRFLGSRETLSQRLNDAGSQFLIELGEAEMRAQTIQKFTRVLVKVTNNFMEDLVKLDSRIPPTESEVQKYIIRTMGVETTPTEAEVREYVRKALDSMKIYEKGTT